MTKKKHPVSIRTPLARARGLGSAKSGTGHWWMQRVTSVMLLPLTLYILFHLGHFLPDPYESNNLIGEIGRPTMSLALILASLSGFYHGWLGVQVIIEDYVHNEGAKMAALVGNALLFFFLGAACVFSVLYIDFALMAQMGRY
jgi:succinate dehydrogenase / fumarate reductase membrane anchor subunit